jgi:hypothetical protein
MEYLLEVRWDDPIAAALGRILLSGLAGADQTTSSVPDGRNRAFVVYRCNNPDVLDGLRGAVSDLVALVRITPIARDVAPLAA